MSTQTLRIHVLHGGLQTSVQAGPRQGLGALGVRCAGALDAYSQTIANLLVGNAKHAPVLESALLGPTLRFEQAARIAICGADCDVRVDGLTIAQWRPVLLPAGSTLRLGACTHGARSVLAIAGDWQLEPVLGSISTDLPGGFGGVQGRALQAHDVLELRAPSLACTQLQWPRWWINPEPDLALHADAPVIVRMLPGSDATLPANAWEGRWRVSPRSNRQALRLEGDSIHVANPGQRLSAPVRPGTLQMPGDGSPILLLADAQSHGGYPRIAHAIRADFPRLAQLRPGQDVHLQAVTAAQAQQLAHAQRTRLAKIAQAIAAASW